VCERERERERESRVINTVEELKTPLQYVIIRDLLLVLYDAQFHPPPARYI